MFIFDNNNNKEIKGIKISLIYIGGFDLVRNKNDYLIMFIG